jgi:hypothetical protein
VRVNGRRIAMLRPGATGWNRQEKAKLAGTPNREVMPRWWPVAPIRIIGPATARLDRYTPTGRQGTLNQRVRIRHILPIPDKPLSES